MWPILLSAIPLILHGLANFSGFLVAWTPGAYGYANRAWLFSDRVTLKSPFGHIFGLLWLATTLLLVASGGAIFFYMTWWRWTAIAGAGLSLLVILVWWRAVPPGARFGAFFDLATVLVLAPSWGAAVVSRINPTYF